MRSGVLSTAFGISSDDSQTRGGVKRSRRELAHAISILRHRYKPFPSPTMDSLMVFVCFSVSKLHRLLVVKSFQRSPRRNINAIRPVPQHHGLALQQVHIHLPASSPSTLPDGTRLGNPRACPPVSASTAKWPVSQ